MDTDPSLHLVLLSDPTSYGLNYQKFRDEVAKYLSHREISERGWCVLSKDDDGKIKKNLSKFLPVLSPDHRLTKSAVKIVGGSVINSSITEKKPTGDPSQRLYVVQVYHPESTEAINADMKDLYEKLGGPPVSPRQAQIVAASS